MFATLARPPGKRGSRALRLALLIGVPVLFIGYLALVSTEQFAFAKFAQGYPAGHAIGCGLVALFFGALVAGGAMFAWRGTDPYNPGISGAMIGMVGGLASGAGMSVACPSHEAFHSCFAHGMVVFALALAGVWVRAANARTVNTRASTSPAPPGRSKLSKAADWAMYVGIAGLFGVLVTRGCFGSEEGARRQVVSAAAGDRRRRVPPGRAARQARVDGSVRQLVRRV